MWHRGTPATNQELAWDVQKSKLASLLQYQSPDLNPYPSYTRTTENPTNTEFTMTCNGATRKREERTNPRESSSYAAFWLASNIPRVPPASVAFLVKLAAHAKQILEKIIIGQRSVGTTTSFRRKTEVTVLIVIHTLIMDGNCLEQTFFSV